MNEHEYEQQLQELFGQEPPPQEVLAEVTPFHTAITRITTGLVLTRFSISIGWLPQILLAVGILQLYLGARTLRRENLGLRLL